MPMVGTAEVFNRHQPWATFFGRDSKVDSVQVILTNFSNMKMLDSMDYRSS